MRLFPTTFDENVKAIANYHSIPFDVKCKDGGYAIRAIEIQRFNKIKPLLDKFNELTGYVIPYTECTASEMNLLVARGLSVIDAANKAHKEAIDDAKSVDVEIDQAKKGKRGGSSGFESLRAYLLDLEHKKERVDGFIATTDKLLQERRNLLGMLRQQAEILSAKNDPELTPVILTQIPIEPLKGCPIKETYFNKSDSPILYAWKELDVLEAALRKIISSCTTPTDKYELNNGGERKTQYYREYYSTKGAELRQRMTVIEYVTTKYQCDNNLTHKINMMNSSI